MQCMKCKQKSILFLMTLQRCKRPFARRAGYWRGAFFTQGDMVPRHGTSESPSPAEGGTVGLDTSGILDAHGSGWFSHSCFSIHHLHTANMSNFKMKKPSNKKKPSGVSSGTYRHTSPLRSAHEDLMCLSWLISFFLFIYV